MAGRHRLLRGRRRNLSVLLLACALATGLASAWWGLREARVSPIADPHGAPEDGRARVGSPEPESTVPAAPAALSSGPAPPLVEGRVEIAPADPRASAGPLWVEGRVVFPEGRPADEPVRVVAVGRKLEGGGFHGVEVGADGRFRVAFAERTRAGWLRLEARRLYMLGVRVDLRALEPEYVLEPSLGGRLLGRVRPPEGIEPGSFAGVQVRLILRRITRNPDGSTSHESDTRVCPLDPGGRFAFDGLPAGLPLDLECQPRGWAESALEDLLLHPLEEREVELPLRRGVEVAGRIVDPRGADLRRAMLFVEVDGAGTSFLFGPSGGARPAPDGSFNLLGVKPGDLRLRATLAGRADALLEVGPAADGERREGLEVRFSATPALAGRVLWPDGAPAGGVEVLAIERTYSGASSADREHATRTAADGSFRLEGPVAPWVLVLASAERRERSGRARYQAVVEDVSSGSEALLLRLAPAPTIAGRVVDDAGEPVLEFDVRAERVRVELPWPERDAFRPLSDRSGVGDAFSSTDGRFVLEGLIEGRWRVRVRSAGFATPLDAIVDVPDGGAEHAFVLARQGTIAGRVLRVDGTPAAGAKVVAAGSIATTSDAAGGFELAVDPGRVAVSAFLEDSLPSTPVELIVEPGLRVEGVELRPGAGARLTGEVTRPPLANRSVLLQSPGAGQRFARTDRAGRFAFTGLADGEHTVVLQADPSAPSSAASARVTVAEGRSLHIALGSGPLDPIEIFGVVSAGGVPLGGATLRVQRPEGPVPLPVSSEAGGSYALTVDGPGDYLVQVTHGATTVTRRERVPPRPRHRLDLSLDGSRLSGRVLDPGGRPVEDAWVQLHLEPGDAERRATIVAGDCLTEEEGAFAFEGLAAGTYAVSVSGTALAPARRGGLRLDGAGDLAGIEVRLTLAGMVEGVARNSHGAPASGARVYARDEEGAIRAARTLTDWTGRYRIEGLAAGPWSVFATDGLGLVSEETPPLRVDGDVVRQDLTLRPGTRLRVRVRDATGREVGASLSAVDAKGREHALGMPGAPTGGARTLGPLAPGTYRITARNHGGASASATVQVGGEPEQVLELRLQGP